MSEPLDSQVQRLADFIIKHVPGEPSGGQGAIDTAIRILSRHYGPDAKPGRLAFPENLTGEQAEQFAEAIRKATENPGKTFEVGQ